jgi:hypothetical protein
VNTTPKSRAAFPRELRAAVLWLGIPVILATCFVTWSSWGFIETMTGGVFKPKWEDYETMIATDALIGLTPREAARLIEYPADLGESDGKPFAEFYLQHLGIAGWVWITADLDEGGRITHAEVIVD